MAKGIAQPSARVHHIGHQSPILLMGAIAWRSKGTAPRRQRVLRPVSMSIFCPICGPGMSKSAKFTKSKQK